MYFRKGYVHTCGKQKKISFFIICYVPSILCFCCRCYGSNFWKAFSQRFAFDLCIHIHFFLHSCAPFARLSGIKFSVVASHSIEFSSSYCCCFFFSPLLSRFHPTIQWHGMAAEYTDWLDPTFTERVAIYTYIFCCCCCLPHLFRTGKFEGWCLVRGQFGCLAF